MTAFTHFLQQTRKAQRVMHTVSSCTKMTDNWLKNLQLLLHEKTAQAWLEFMFLFISGCWRIWASPRV